MEFVCGNDWGIGINFHPKKSPSYGYPECTNPNLFYPDHEVSTNEEFLSWIRACSEHNKTMHTDGEITSADISGSISNQINNSSAGMRRR